MGPCLCGDPYCSSCGNPAAAAIEDAESKLMELLNGENLTPDEYEIVGAAGLAVVHTIREQVKKALAAIQAESEAAK